MTAVELIPAFQDNYIFLIASQGRALVVDPGSAAEVLACLQDHSLLLDTILITHHHHDHVGGVAELKRRTGAKVHAPKHVRDLGLPVDTVCVEGDSVQAQGIDFEVLAVPGHTLDHLAYVSREHEILFCGDTLFSLGCGRLFEGTAGTMFASLAKLKALPPVTRVFCAHEYTLKNFEFSLNQISSPTHATEVPQYESIGQQLRARRAQQHPTVPSTLDFELKYNLFLRAPSAQAFQELRDARNTF